MNYQTQKQLLAMRFSCALCGYGSKLDLEECPGCGRLKTNENRQPTEPENHANKRILEAFANALPVAESYLFVCEHCRYQTRRQLGECPECGRGKFAKFDVSARRDGAGFRAERTVSNSSEVGRFLLMLGISLLIGAFFLFLGFEPSGNRRMGRPVYGVGENWQIALVFFLTGVGAGLAGFILKNRT